MRSTLFFIPHEIAGWPLFGVGILFWLILAGFVVWGAVTKWRGQSADILGTLPLIAIVLAVVAFVLPNVEQTWPDGTPIGLPIRGYGVMVLCGLIAGIGICAYRGRQLGVPVDTVMGLGFWMMLTGVLGARLFYVIQKWNTFQSFGEVFQVTEGGLVIYGGVIGGLVAAVVFCLRHKLGMWATADLVAPGFLIGLAFGRIGCLLHGCCFGGICDSQLPAVRFPQGSFPYQSQLSSGKLLGLETDATGRSIESIRPQSLAEERGIQAPGQIQDLTIQEVEPRKDSDPTRPPELFAEIQVDGARHSFLPDELPQFSLPAHPTQIYSSINAVILCLLIWVLQPFPRHDGIAFCVALVLYSVSRFLIEWVRDDELGQLGTTLTISQLVSATVFFVACGALLWLSRTTAGRVWNWEAAS